LLRRWQSQEPLHANRAGDLSGGPFLWILQLRRDEPAIDEDYVAARFPKGCQDVIPLSPRLRCRAEKDLLAVQEYSVGRDGVEFHAASVFQSARGGHGGCRYRRLALRDQIPLPEEPLDLPKAECKTQQYHRRGKERRPQPRAKPGHLRVAVR